MGSARDVNGAGRADDVGTHGMFSAASFAGVVAEYRSDKAPTPDTIASPPVIAFYGFRGGAGRTTALAHVAALLSSRQLQVVAIDLDLEAPGLAQVLDCPEIEEDRGTLSLLRLAATTPDSEISAMLRLAPHVVKSGVDAGAPIRVLPAGKLSTRYLERLDDLGVPLWHVAESSSPLELLVNRVKEELRPDAILLDCRTGLSGLSASALFHVADVVVCLVPVSSQSLEGLSVFLKALKAAKLRRAGRPESLIVPSMVPEGPDGRRRLEEWFVPQLEASYAQLVLATALSDDNAEELSERVPVVSDGIEYRRGIALADRVRSDFVQRSSGVYEPLMRELDSLVRVGVAPPTVHVDAKTVLSQLAEQTDLKSLAFAESTDPGVIVQKFIKPADFKAIVDRSTWYVVGAKGAGKTWLWQYLNSDVGQAAVPDSSFLAAHGPKPILSQSAMRELERAAKLERRQLYGAFWLLYGANRILARHPGLLEIVAGRVPSSRRRVLTRLAQATSASLLQEALSACLKAETAGTFAEDVTRFLDDALLSQGVGTLTLLYDGLDTGFGSDPRSIDTRTRYVNGLVEVIEPLRGSLKRLGFKLFLREDIYSAISIQNQSHLSAATVELTWSPRDLWLLALNLVAASSSYVASLRAIDGSVGPGQWPQDEERLRELLVPLWGDQMERGNKISTARFVQRRTSDGKDRLFPRTLVQLLALAVDHQRALAPSPDRVLRSAAIINGYNKASEQRVEDLRKEYFNLSRYLDALKGRKPTGTESEIVDSLKKGVGKRASTPSGKAKGAPAGALHAGPGGWHKVIERLLEVGVLREYRRAKGDAGQTKYEIALLYRPGLGIRAFGV